MLALVLAVLRILLHDLFGGLVQIFLFFRVELLFILSAGLCLTLRDLFS